MVDIEKLSDFSPEEARCALQEATELVRASLPGFTDHFKSSNSENGFYWQTENVEWTTGFWTGQIWLAYEAAEDKEAFRKAAEVQVDSFLERIINRVDVNHHDMGFLYSLSCVSAWKLTRNGNARKAALLAADNLISRFQEKGQFIQAWGDPGDPKEYRLIIDCLLNLPLLYWATEETGDEKYRDIAERHLNTALDYCLRPDDSTYHTYFFDPETGEPVRGVTHQGNRDGSAWARGQAWAVYGSALAYRHVKSQKAFSVFHRSLQYFLSHLPADVVPYWDFDFDNPSDEPRDSSALAIVCCAMLEAADNMGDENLRALSGKLLKVLHETCAVKDPATSNGVLLHGTYARGSKFNTCKNRGVDECNIWGDYYYLEALRRLTGKWDPYW